MLFGFSLIIMASVEFGQSFSSFANKFVHVLISRYKLQRMHYLIFGGERREESVSYCVIHEKLKFGLLFVLFPRSSL